MASGRSSAHRKSCNIIERKAQSGHRAAEFQCPPLTHAASVDCLFYFINRGLRRQGIGSRSNRHAVFAVPNEDFERRAIRFSNLSAPPTLLALKRTNFKALMNFDFVHLSPLC